ISVHAVCVWLCIIYIYGDISIPVCVCVCVYVCVCVCVCVVVSLRCCGCPTQDVLGGAQRELSNRRQRVYSLSHLWALFLSARASVCHCRSRGRERGREGGIERKTEGQRMKEERER